MKYKKFILLPSFETNTYLLWDEDSREAMLIDPAAAGKEVDEEIAVNNLTLMYIVNTHGHGDHIGGNNYFKNKYKNTKLCIHKDDEMMLIKSDLNLSLYYEQETLSPQADLLLEDGMTLKLGHKEIKVIHTPGHSKGSLSLLCDKLLFSGDTLFCEEVGRTDLPGGSFSQLTASIQKKLFILPNDIVALPGHGDSTSIGHEKKANPYVSIE